MAGSIALFKIIGCADITRNFSRAIALAPNATVAVVASRSVVKANNLPSDCKIFGSYESVLDDPEIDVVYLSLPTSLHLKWAVLADEKKKHVLIEKPMALNVAD